VSAVTTTGIGITTALALIVAPWAGIIDERPVVPESAWMVFSDDIRQAGFGTATGKFAQKVDAVSALSSIVARLKSESGLTADQLGRLLGVSRRSIHNWAAGSAIASVHEEKLRELESLIFSIPASTPDERRSLLLDSSNGRSLFKQFASKADGSQRIKFGVPVEERLGL
jgi:transcriptional regulator with XRE-family HTH domain